MKNKIKASHIFAVVVFVLLTLEGVIGVKSIRGLQNQLYTQIREYHELQEDYYNLQTVIERMNEDELFFCIYSELKDFDPVKRTGNLLVSFGVNDYEHFEEGRAVFDGTEHELQPDLQNLGYFDMEIPVTENTWIDQIEVSMTIAGKKYIRIVTPLMCGLSEYPLDAGYKDAVKISSDVIYKYSLFDMHQIKKQTYTEDTAIYIRPTEWSGKAPVLHYGTFSHEKTCELLQDEERSDPDNYIVFHLPEKMDKSDVFYVTYETKSGANVKWVMDLSMDEIVWYEDLAEDVILYGDRIRHDPI